MRGRPGKILTVAADDGDNVFFVGEWWRAKRPPFLKYASIYASQDYAEAARLRDALSAARAADPLLALRNVRANECTVHLLLLSLPSAPLFLLLFSSFWSRRPAAGPS